MVGETVAIQVVDRAKKLSRQKNEPLWLTEKRISSLKIFEELPFQQFADSPTQRSYTKLKEIDFTSFEPANLEVKIPEISKELKSKGVVLTDLHSALASHEELVKKHLLADCVPSNESKLTALHSAFWSNGLFLYVPKEVEIAEQIIFDLSTSNSGKGLFFHTLIILGEGAKANFIEKLSSPESEENAFHSKVTEIFLNKDSKLHFSGIQNWSQNVIEYKVERARVQENASIQLVNAAFGCRTTIHKTETFLLGNRAESLNLNIYLAEKEQHFDFTNHSYHEVANTTSNVINNGVLRDKSFSIFRGTIYVKEKASGSNANLEGNAIVLSKEARSNSLPALEIDNDNVQVRHAASVSQVDEEQLFYLRSRGLAKSQAEKMIIEGYLQSVLEHITLETIKEHINTLIQERIKDLGASEC